MPSAPLNRAFVQILELNSGEPLGCGVLVSSRVVVTVGHVVAVTGRRLLCRFPFLSGVAPIEAVGSPNEMSIERDAVVSVYLNSVAPKGCARAQVVPTNDVPVGTRVIGFGFPEGYSDGGLPYAGEVVAFRPNSSLVVRSDSELPLAKGFSGGPLWSERLGGVVGLVSSFKSETAYIGFAKPSTEILAEFPSASLVFGQDSNLFDPWAIPNGSLPRDALVGQALECLLCRVPGRSFGLCVLVGNSGFGKSQLAASIGGQLDQNPRAWVDARLAKFSRDLTKNAVSIVIDGVSKGGALQLDQLYAGQIELKSLLITTSEPSVGDQILRALGCAKEVAARIVQVPALTGEEVNNACQMFGAPHTQIALSEMMESGRDVSPAQLRILASAEHKGWTTSSASKPRWSDLLLEALPWLVESGLGLRAVGALACVSRAGIPLHYLSEVLACGQLDLIPELDYLLRQRLVRVIPSGSYDADPVLRTHACLSEGVQWLEKAGYVSKYDEILQSREWDRRDFVCRLEKWCGAVEDVFNHQLFRERDHTNRPLEDLADLTGRGLAAILPEGFPVDEAMVVARCLGPSVHESRCDDVIALSAIGQAALRYGGSPVWADVLQEGWRHHDSWARGACILASARHYATREHLRRQALASLTSWWHEFRYGQRRQLKDQSDLDVDIGAAYAGALRLGGDQQLWTESFALNWQVREILCDMETPFIVPALSMLELAARGRFMDVRRVVDTYWRLMPECEGKRVLRDYLKERLGPHAYFPVGGAGALDEKLDWSLPSLIDASHSEEFEAFAAPRTQSRFSLYSLAWKSSHAH